MKYVCFCGIPISLTGMCAMAAICTAVDLPQGVFPYMAVLPLMTGGFFAAHPCGRALRRHGIFTGAVCALLLDLMWYLAARICTVSVGLPLFCLLLTLPFGMAGGVTGVNRPPKLPRKMCHIRPSMPRKPKRRKKRESSCNLQGNML